MKATINPVADINLDSYPYTPAHIENDFCGTATTSATVLRQFGILVTLSVLRPSNRIGKHSPKKKP